MWSITMVHHHFTCMCQCCIECVPSPAKLCEQVLGLKAVQHLSALLAVPGESEATINMGLKALFVLVESGVKISH